MKSSQSSRLTIRPQPPGRAWLKFRACRPKLVLSQRHGRASIRPDTEFGEEDRSTAPWHYIDICLQDGERDVPARCTDGNCVTAKIDEHARGCATEITTNGAGPASSPF